MNRKRFMAMLFLMFCLLFSTGVLQAGVSKTKKTKAQTPVVLVLDAGHGGTDSGAVGNGYQEKKMTLKIILEAKKYFDKDSRFKVYYTRTKDKSVSLKSRYTFANKKKADLYISVHINAATSSASGTYTLYNAKYNSKTKKNGRTSKELAKKMQKAMSSATGFPDRGIVDRSDLITLGHMDMPSCMIETGFITNKKEARSMNKNLNVYGKKLYQAIVAYTIK